MDDLYADPALYDAIAPFDPEMAAFYDAGLRRGDRVLELACGTGRFTLPLSKSAGSLVATDLDSGMLAVARQRLAAAGLKAEFMELDMRDFNLGRRFDRVVVAANALMHLLRTEDLIACFSAVRRHLEPGGEFRFDVFVPSAALLSMPTGQRAPVGEGRFSTAAGDVLIEETIEYNPFTQISTADWFWSRPGSAPFRTTRLRLRQIYPMELPMLLEAAGLRLAARYGDFSGSPFGTGFRQVCIATPA